MPRMQITEQDLVDMMKIINEKEERNLNLTKNIMTGAWQIIAGQTVIIEGAKATIGQCLTFYCRMNEYVPFA